MTRRILHMVGGLLLLMVTDAIAQEAPSTDISDEVSLYSSLAVIALAAALLAGTSTIAFSWWLWKKVRVGDPPPTLLTAKGEVSPEMEIAIRRYLARFFVLPGVLGTLFSFGLGIAIRDVVASRAELQATEWARESFEKMEADLTTRGEALESQLIASRDSLNEQLDQAGEDGDILLSELGSKVDSAGVLRTRLATVDSILANTGVPQIVRALQADADFVRQVVAAADRQIGRPIVYGGHVEHPMRYLGVTFTVSGSRVYCAEDNQRIAGFRLSATQDADQAVSASTGSPANLAFGGVVSLSVGPQAFEVTFEQCVELNGANDAAVLRVRAIT